jgi:hypothetical protein
MRKAQVVLLKLFLPGRDERTAGILLLDPNTGCLHVRIRDDWDRIADPEDAEVLSCIAADFRQRIEELGEGGGREFLKQIQDQFSNALRLTDSTPVEVDEIDSTLDRLFSESCLI